jgi:hypothetical protein
MEVITIYKAQCMSILERRYTDNNAVALIY